MRPYFCKLNDGWFLTYSVYDSTAQPMLWLNESHTLVREQVWNTQEWVMFVCADSERSRICTYSLSFIGGRVHYNLRIRAFDSTGVCVTNQNLFTETLPLGANCYDPVFHEQGGQVLATVVSFEPVGDHDEFRARLITYADSVVTVRDPQWIADCWGDESFSDVAVTHGPAETFVLGYVVRNYADDRQSFRLAAFDSTGAPLQNIEVALVDGNQDSGEIAVLIAWETAYVGFATEHWNSPDSGGAFALALPVANLLEAREHVPVPTVTSLAVHPNPFNSVARIAFDLPRADHLRLTVVNIEGREVAVLADGLFSAGSHTVNFDASHLASGVYVATLRSGSTVHSQKMVLLK